jgi:NAD(P)-dependent dehydrogenase (short-subunit alcohol dehydrogenase family)
MSKTILITGASRGFGKLWTEAFLKRGDKVAAAVRNLDSLQYLEAQYGDQLLLIQLDVNDRKACLDTVTKVQENFGRIDVLINNAGYGLFGAVEETSEDEARRQMETNFFGLLWMTQAVLPIMRSQLSGHIIQVSSYLGLVTVPTLGVYNASKFAVEGLSETLSTEVKHFGIKVTLVEPNAYQTDWGGSSAAQTTTIEAYQPVRDAFQQALATPGLFGDPKATTNAILQLTDEQNPPLRLLLGKFAVSTVVDTYHARLAEFDQWKEVSVAAHGLSKDL